MRSHLAQAPPLQRVLAKALDSLVSITGLVVGAIFGAELGAMILILEWVPEESATPLMQGAMTLGAGLCSALAHGLNRYKLPRHAGATLGEMAMGYAPTLDPLAVVIPFPDRGHRNTQTGDTTGDARRSSA